LLAIGDRETLGLAWGFFMAAPFGDLQR